MRREIPPAGGDARRLARLVLFVLLAGCGATGSDAVRAKLAAGDVRGALVEYDRAGGEDRAQLAAMARAVLQSALRDPELAVRQKALDALAAAGPGAADMLQALAKDEGSPALQALSLARLARQGDGSAASVLRARIDDADPTTRAEATALLDPHEEAARLRERLADPAPAVRRAAASRLAHAPAEAETSLALTRAARTDPDGGVRRACLLALGGQGALATQVLLEQLSDADADVRLAAASSLFLADPSAAEARFAHELSAEPSAERIEAARQVLAGPRHEALRAAALDQLKRALEWQDGALRAQAAVALAAIDDGDARRLALARAPHEGMRSIKLWLALAMGGSEGRAALRALGDARDVVAAQASAELGRMGEAGALADLRELLSCTEPRVRVVVVRALGRELDRAQAIRGALLDADLDVRLAAASALLATA